MIGQLTLGAAVVLTTVGFHVAGLALLSALLARLGRAGRRRRLHGTAAVLGIAALAILAIHTVEGWFWAAVYLALGEFKTMEEALYFSFATATTVGYGDVVLGKRWRVLSTFEAMAGMILFAVSAAYLLDVLRRFGDGGGSLRGAHAEEDRIQRRNDHEGE